ncbi:MAG TPA: hypothetical protein VIL88_10490 [Devosia sp.]|jgi:hypothetical protein|uniref:hypothetical protein n=1 Tax=Devosia sp. TaxID=1871048 RepID=UPI002F95B818
MRKFAVAASLSLFATSSVLAALPPHYQRQAELIAILNEPDVVNALAPNAIDSIQMSLPIISKCAVAAVPLRSD